MSSRNYKSQTRISLSNKTIMKDIKRDLIKFVPLIARRTRRSTRDFESPDKAMVSCDYGKTFDHMNPTVSSNQKRCDIIYSSICEIKPRVNSSNSVERTNKRKLLSKRDEKEYNPKKLVYPSVRKLKSWMNKTQ